MPIIAHLLSIGCEVIIAADAKHQALFISEFKKIKIVEIAGYRLQFGTTRITTMLKIFFQVPKIMVAIHREKRWLAKFITTNKVHAIISDNRYGFRHRGIPSIFITHQLNIKTPFGRFFEKQVQQLNYRFISGFDACWVPDYAGAENLGGELSHPRVKPTVPTSYLGRVTRFENIGSASNPSTILVILSGPEPQRSILENILLNEFNNCHCLITLIRGLPHLTAAIKSPSKNITIYNHLPGSKLNEAINDAGIIVARPGYSTVMDLVGRRKKCIFIATPGQTEQEYLAKYLASKRYCVSVKQGQFNLVNAIGLVEKLEIEPFHREGSDDYRQVLNEFAQSLSINPIHQMS